jgi:ubiquinone/menaquinone biosynthesis C-methylase UbiE
MHPAGSWMIMRGLTNTASDIAALFGRAAPSYNRVGPPFFSELATRLVQHVHLRPTDRVLDVATGTGAVLAEVARRAPQVQLAGVDLSPQMIEEARQRLRDLGRADVDLRVMDGEQLAFEPDSFDVVFCSSGLDLLPDPPTALRNWRRVLLGDGTLAVAVFGDEGWEWRRELRARFTEAPEPLTDNFTAHALEEVIRSAGFPAVTVHAERLDVPFADAAEWWATQWSHGERAALERMEAQALRAYRRAAAEAIEAFREPDGALHWRPEVLLAVAAG